MKKQVTSAAGGAGMQGETEDHCKFRVIVGGCALVVMTCDPCSSFAQQAQSFVRLQAGVEQTDHAVPVMRAMIAGGNTPPMRMPALITGGNTPPMWLDPIHPLTREWRPADDGDSPSSVRSRGRGR